MFLDVSIGFKRFQLNVSGVLGGFIGFQGYFEWIRSGFRVV